MVPCTPLSNGPLHPNHRQYQTQWTVVIPLLPMTDLISTLAPLLLRGVLNPLARNLYSNTAASANSSPPNSQYPPYLALTIPSPTQITPSHWTFWKIQKVSSDLLLSIRKVIAILHAGDRPVFFVKTHRPAFRPLLHLSSNLLHVTQPRQYTLQEQCGTPCLKTQLQVQVEAAKGHQRGSTLPSILLLNNV